MLIRFTLDDMDNYALNETRFCEFYDLARSYAGISCGTHWSSQQCMTWLFSGSVVLFPKEGSDDIVFVLRDQEFFLDLVSHAYDVNTAMLALKIALRNLHLGKGDFKTIKLLKSSLVAMLRQTEL